MNQIYAYRSVFKNAHQKKITRIETIIPVDLVELFKRTKFTNISQLQHMTCMLLSAETGLRSGSLFGRNYNGVEKERHWAGSLVVCVSLIFMNQLKFFSWENEAEFEVVVEVYDHKTKKGPNDM